VPKMHIVQLPITPPSVQSVDWLIGKLDWGNSLRSWIPTGFERYVRILHPAYISIGKAGSTREVPVPWANVSQWSGKALHATSHIQDLMVRADGHDWRRRGEGGDEPRQGKLEWTSFSCLLTHLAQETPTSKDIWMLIWTGYGGMSDTVGLPVEVSEGLSKSGRRYVLRLGAIDSSEKEFEYTFDEYPPTFWWPADRTWFAICDIDSVSTYVGGSEELIAQILADPCLEAFPANLDDSYDGLYVKSVVVENDDGYVLPRRRIRSFLRHNHLFRSRNISGGSAVLFRRQRWWEWWMKP
jgi:hypothetical protein